MQCQKELFVYPTSVVPKGHIVWAAVLLNRAVEIATAAREC